MESIETTSREIRRGEQDKAETDDRTLFSNKPLHRFLRRDPRSFGLVVLIFGCAEMLMGPQQHYDPERNTVLFYFSMVQGALCITCGILSILTNIRPSKKMVTICLAMYVVSILGGLITFFFRMSMMIFSRFMWYRFYSWNNLWRHYRHAQIMAVDAILLTCTAFVLGLLVFLSTIARFALKSTHTQVVIHCVPHHPESDVTAD